MSDIHTNLTGDELELVFKARREAQHEEYKYLHLLEKIVSEGIRCPNRTGVDALTLPHEQMSFDMSKGFPLFTHKKMATKTFKIGTIVS